jgi:phospholipase/carboxylesterase
MREGTSIRASLEHVVYFPEKPAQSYPTIIALHGRGTDEYDLIPLVLSLGRTDMLIVSPCAPFPFEFGSGFAWYRLGEEWTPDPETFRTSLERLRNFVSEVRAGYPVNSSRIILLGFSQGTVMSYSLALTDPHSFRGIAALSGYIPQRSGLTLKLNEIQSLSVFISHGTYDQVIPVRLGREAEQLLTRAGVDVTYREYPMGHEVKEATIRDLSMWFNKLPI